MIKMNYSAIIEENVTIHMNYSHLESRFQFSDSVIQFEAIHPMKM